MDDVQPGDDGKRARNVDLIIDGHSHVEHEVKIDENSWLVQADHYGVKLGEVVLDYSRSERRVVGAPKMRRVTLLTKEVPVHAGMMADFAAKVTEARALEESILVPASPELRIPALPRTATRELANPSGDLFTRAMLETARSFHGVEGQVSIVNQTGVRAGLYSSKKGGITRGGVHAVAPFANQLVTLQVTASGLLKLLDKEGIQHRSKLSWAGLELVAEQNGTGRGAELKRKIVRCDLVDAKTGARTPLADLGDQPVTVVCPDFIAGRELKKIAVPDTQRDLRLLDREALEKFLEVVAQGDKPLDSAKLQQLLGTPA
jgi:2',3'-cyclic-nucleotide 2'-phosphodiesterase (5'-nucleotidase family)